MRQQLGDERVNEMLRRLRDGDQDQKKDDQQQEQKKDEQEGAAPPAAPGGAPTGYKNYAPDKKKYAYLYKSNLYLGEEGQPEDKAAQLTTLAHDDVGAGRPCGSDDPFDHAHPDQVDEELAGQDLLHHRIAEVLPPRRTSRVGLEAGRLDRRGEGG
jgi:hypothetical protein